MRSSIEFAFCIAGVLVFASVIQAQNTRGTPGVDYPNYHSIPETSFSCLEQNYIPGFYADLETKCQAFHFCFQKRQESFLCPTGTIFNQEILACDAWYNSNCSLAPLFYNVNAGPAMENAGKKLPMLLKLRNRSVSKSTIPTSTANIYEKITSLYETSTDSTTPSQDIETATVSKTPDSESKAINEASNIAPVQSSDIKVQSEQFPENAFFELGGNLQENVSEGETYGEDHSEEESMIEEMDNLVYDPVTDGYYMNYDQYETEWQRDSEPVSDEFSSFYDFGNLANEYEELEDTSGSLSYEDSGDLNVIGDAVDEAVFSKRQLKISQSPVRVRRQPIYVVVREDEDDLEVTSSRPESSESFTTGEVESITESLETATEEGSEINATSEEHSVKQEANEELFPRPQRIPPHRRENYYTEKPLTTAEFERAIITELVEPGLDDENLGRIIGSTHMQLQSEVTSTPLDEVNEESRGDMLADFQGDDQSIYAEDVMAQEGYVLDASAYGLKGEIIEDSEGNTVMEVYEESEADPSFQTGEETPVEDADDTFVVIPDEDESEQNVADSPSVEGRVDKTESTGYVDNGYVYEDVGTNEQMDADGQSIPQYETYEDAYRYYGSRFQFPQIYEPTDSLPFRPVPETKISPYDIRGDPNVAERKAPFAIEDDFNNYTPEMARAMWQYMLNDYRRRNYGSQLGHQRDQSMSYVPSFYGTGSPYLSEDQYTNPYMENEGMFNEASDYTNEYFDSENAAWVEQDSIESAEMENAFGVTDSTLPVSVTEADLDESSSVYLNEETDEESSKQNEDAYYVFDFGEEDNESKLVRDTETLESDIDKSIHAVESEHNDLQTPYETEQRNLLSSDASTSSGNISLATGTDKSLESSKTGSDDIRSLDSLTSQNGKMKSSTAAELGTTFNAKPVTDTASFRATESSLIDEKPVTLSSALERLAALKAIKSPQASSVENLDFSSDPRFISNMAFPESMDFGSYGFGANMGQQYGMLDSIQPSKTADLFSHRTGETEQSRLSKMSAIQERIRSMKQGKFGVFKKYMNSARNQKD